MTEFSSVGENGGRKGFETITAMSNRDPACSRRYIGGFVWVSDGFSHSFMFFDCTFDTKDIILVYLCLLKCG